MQTTRIIRLPELKAITGLSRTRLYEAMRLGTFPAPVKLSVRAVGWRSTDVDEWIAALPSARTAAGNIH